MDLDAQIQRQAHPNDPHFFKGLKFWIAQRVPTRSEIVKDVKVTAAQHALTHDCVANLSAEARW